MEAAAATATTFSHLRVPYRWPALTRRSEMDKLNRVFKHASLVCRLLSPRSATVPVHRHRGVRRAKRAARLPALLTTVDVLWCARFTEADIPPTRTPIPNPLATLLAGPPTAASHAAAIAGHGCYSSSSSSHHLHPPFPSPARHHHPPPVWLTTGVLPRSGHRSRGGEASKVFRNAVDEEVCRRRLATRLVGRGVRPSAESIWSRLAGRGAGGVAREGGASVSMAAHAAVGVRGKVQL
uniref:Uncharacterized protein n=1 Tax=Oryza glumipatula TaxID=40148 RepID=A0A0E0BSW5_9ORYZ